MNAHTPDDARKLWCPMARGTNFTRAKSFDIERGEVHLPRRDYCCLASACMMWQWLNPDNPDKGYCGLARGR